MPEHHEIADVLLAVKSALGEVAGTLGLPDLIMELRGPCLQYRASGLSHIDHCFNVVGGHGGLREGGKSQRRPSLICSTCGGRASGSASRKKCLTGSPDLCDPSYPVTRCFEIAQ